MQDAFAFVVSRQQSRPEIWNVALAEGDADDIILPERDGVQS